MAPDQDVVRLHARAISSNGRQLAKRETFHADAKHDYDTAHFVNFIDAVRAGKPDMVNNDPDLAAAAVMMVNLAVRSYREGKVFHVDREGRISDGDASWALGWEKMSKERAKPRHVPGSRCRRLGQRAAPARVPEAGWTLERWQERVVNTLRVP